MSLKRIALAYTFAIFTMASAAEEPWPLWDGRETVADYAQRLKLPPARPIRPPTPPLRNFPARASRALKPSKQE